LTVRELTLPGSLAQLRLPAWARLLPAFCRDFGIVVAVLLVYFVLRGQAPVNEDFAMSVTGKLVWFEKATFSFWEPEVQDFSIHFYWTQEVVNFIYAYGHFPILAAVGGWLWWRGRERFVFMRNVMFISMIIGLLAYYTLPAAPPRLMALHGQDLGFTDTIFGGHTAVSYAQPAIILNDYAAVPSFHFGWIALASAAMWANSTNRWVRGLAVALSAVMTWAIVASANHFFVDMVLGALAVAFAWWLARRRERQRAGSATAPAA
jgi:hypothetical protein